MLAEKILLNKIVYHYRKQGSQLSFPLLSLSLKKMEFALAQAKKSCPFLHITPTSSLRRLSTLPAGANSTNGLLTKAQQCPVMGKAIAVRTRGISTTAAAAQKPTPSAKAVAVESAENGM